MKFRVTRSKDSHLENSCSGTKGRKICRRTTKQNKTLKQFPGRFYRYVDDLLVSISSVLQGKPMQQDLQSTIQNKSVKDSQFIFLIPDGLNTQIESRQSDSHSYISKSLRRRQQEKELKMRRIRVYPIEQIQKLFKEMHHR